MSRSTPKWADAPHSARESHPSPLGGTDRRPAAPAAPRAWLSVGEMAVAHWTLVCFPWGTAPRPRAAASLVKEVREIGRERVSLGEPSPQLSLSGRVQPGWAVSSCPRGAAWSQARVGRYTREGEVTHDARDLSWESPRSGLPLTSEWGPAWRGPQAAILVGGGSSQPAKHGGPGALPLPWAVGRSHVRRCAVADRALGRGGFQVPAARNRPQLR